MSLYVHAPLWLLLPLLMAPWWRQASQSQGLPEHWDRVIQPALHTYLGRYVQGVAASRQRLLWLVLLSALGAALASIQFGQHEAPNQRAVHARILVIDMADPEHIAQTLFHARTLARKAPEFPTAVIASGNDAFDVVPITADPAPLTRYLSVLHPDMMPGTGQAPARGLRRAASMLERAQIAVPQIVLLGGKAPERRESPDHDIQSLLSIAAPSDTVDAWQRWAPRAHVIPFDELAALDGQLNEQKNRLQRRIQRASSGFDLTPAFVIVAMVCWLALFFRREQ